VDLPGQVSMNDLVGQWQAVPARLAGLGPASPNRRAPSRLGSASVVPAQGEHVISAREEGAKELDLRLRCRTSVNLLERLGLGRFREQHRRPRPCCGLGRAVKPEEPSQLGIL
jgi:hypothetical protein